MDSKQKPLWVREVEQSLYAHRAMPLHAERSVQAEFTAKRVLRQLPLAGVPVVPRDMDGCVEPTDDGFLLRAKVRTPARPRGVPEEEQYFPFGFAAAAFPRGNADWRGYNRLYYEIFPRFAGMAVIHVHAIITVGDGVPYDAYDREGTCMVDLKPDQWNECYYEFPELDLTDAADVRFMVRLNGAEQTAAQELVYAFRAVRLEEIEHPEPYEGWGCAPGRIVYSTAGYLRNGEKTALCQGDATEFALLRADGDEPVYRGETRRLANDKGAFLLLDFSTVTEPGDYRLQCGGMTSAPFAVRDDLAEESLWKQLNFLYYERCGFPLPGGHNACHLDAIAHHNGLGVSFAGGWHDAADVSQQAVQSGEIVHALLDAMRRRQPGDALYHRLGEEAQWGLDFLLRTRFGDGYRATSVGCTRWSDGKQGNFDDPVPRVSNHAISNLLLAAVEGFAAEVLAEEAPAMAAQARQAAIEDFGFGLERFEALGVEPAEAHEHIKITSYAQECAAVVWAAAPLYRLTGETRYADAIIRYAAKLLACQEQAGPLPGYFYRDQTRRAIGHFNHQSRESLYMQALEAACVALPDAPERADWERGMRLYGDYLLALRPYAAPYGMIPAGVHRLDEADDEDTFRLMHLMVDFEQERESYRAQLRAGAPLDDERVVRCFPVWFSFRGNTAVQLAMGKNAALLGRYFGDAALTQLGREQLYWVLGKNPFAQSLMYGMGDRYSAEYTVFPGELTGELPVGMHTRADADVPFWPQGVNATYKEVWVGTCARWIWLAAEYQQLR